MVYLDYAATTPYNKDVLKTYTQLLEKYFYNADSIYSQGIEVNRLLEKSRGLLAKMLDVDEEEMIFTSCGSEANNMAIKGIAFQYQNRGKHIITTSIEHSSVYETCKELEEVFGFEVTYLPVDHTGHIQIDDIKKSIRNDTILVSVMCINNEVGSIQPIEEIKNVLQDYPLVKFHVDMVQALGKIKIDLKGIDCASFSAHKINGLKGSGLLFKRKSTTLVPLINGGQQEFGLRGGTSNACTYIVLAKTLRLALENFDQKEKYVSKLSKYLIKELQTIPDVIINTGGKVSSHIVNFSCIGYKPEVILHALEEKDILISTRSACSSKTSDVSRVMQQLHLPDEVAKSALRVSISDLTKEEEIDKFIYCLKEVLDSIKKQR